MKLKNVSARDIKLKVCVFGKPGVGKSHFGVFAPSPIVFDSENKIGSLVETVGHDITCVDYDHKRLKDEFVASAQTARAGFPGCDTFVIDGYTEIERRYEQALGIDTNLSSTVKEERDARKFALYDVRKRIEQELLLPAIAGPTNCHLIVTAYEKNAWADKKTVGYVPDAARNFGHYFDLVFHMQLDLVSKRRTAVVTKSNFQQHFPLGRQMNDLSWKDLEVLLADKVARDGVDMNELVRLHEQLGSPEGSLRSWLISVGFGLSEDKKGLSGEEKLRARALLNELEAERSAA